MNPCDYHLSRTLPFSVMIWSGGCDALLHATFRVWLDLLVSQLSVAEIGPTCCACVQGLVVFDMDSTLIQQEALFCKYPANIHLDLSFLVQAMLEVIDELAKLAGVESQVKACSELPGTPNTTNTT